MTLSNPRILVLVDPGIVPLPILGKFATGDREVVTIDDPSTAVTETVARVPNIVVVTNATALSEQTAFWPFCRK